MKLILSILILLKFSCAVAQDTLKEYWHDGTVKTLLIHNDLSLEQEIGFYNTGKIAYEGYYKNSGKDSIWTWWYENGNLLQILHLSNGMLNGLATTWFENGKIKSEGNYNNNLENGLWTFWYENGVKKIELETKDGNNHGKFTKWYENGQMSTTGSYFNGLQDGVWSFWSFTGVLVSVEKYKMGELIR